MHRQKANQTNLKLPISDHHQQISRPQRDKMKFNWRANWEVLLVFVIIFVGIVITTIAAIRSKDDSMTDYGGGAAGAGIVDLSSSLQVPPLPQTDFQLQSGLAMPSDDHQPTTPGRRPSRSSTPSPNQTMPRTTDRKRSRPTGDSLSATHDMVKAALGEPDPAGFISKTNHSSSNQHRPQTGPGRQVTTASPMRATAQADGYEAMSTEQTPSQTLGSSSSDIADKLSEASFQHGARQSERLRQNGSDGAEPGAKQVRDAERADGNMDQQNDHLEAQLEDGLSSHKVRANNNHHHHHHHHTMQGPYELNHQLQAGAVVHRQQQHQSNRSRSAQQSDQTHSKKIEPLAPSPPRPPTVLDSDDMMTSYTRAPHQNQLNLTEALLRGDYSLAASSNGAFTGGGGKNSSTPLALTTLTTATTTTTTTDDDELPPDYNNHNQVPAQSQTLPLVQYSRVNSGLPFALLLNDLIKLSRPQPLIDSQASLEQPANSRPQQNSLLQQLRLLPGPLAALFQQQTNQMQTSAGNELINNHLLTNHETSESNDHYHRISMTPYNDLNALLARSLRSTNPLPGFPPPRGLPITWVPSNMGGVSVLNEAASNNADFVASETAGFVRGATISSPGGGGGASGMQMAASSPQEELAKASHGSSPLQGTQSGDSPRQDNQQQQQQQQQPASPANNLQQANPPPPVTSRGNQISNQQPQSQSHISFHNQAPQQPTHVAASSDHVAGDATGANILPVVASNAGQVANQASHQRGNPYIMQQQQQQQQQQQPRFDINSNSLKTINAGTINQLTQANLRLAPVGGVIVAAQQISSNPLRLNNLSKRTLAVNAPQHSAQTANRLNAPNRVRRSADEEQMDGSEESSAPSMKKKKQKKQKSSDADDERSHEEEYLDSGPVSIVRPDGGPIVAREVAVGEQTRAFRDNRKRPLNPADLSESALHHYASNDMGASSRDADQTNSNSAASQGRTNTGPADQTQLASHLRVVQSADGDYERPEATPITSAGPRPRKSKKQASLREMEQIAKMNRSLNNGKPLRATSSRNKLSEKRHKPKRQSSVMGKRKRLSHGQMAALNLDAASSGLMSKLLGVASTTDELEDDMDGDDDESPNERRKEELEDAEFGIVNDDRQSSGPSSASDGANSNDIGGGGGGGDGVQDNNDVSRLTQDNNAPSQEAGQAEMPPIRSAGSTDSNAYARRNQQQQQRSDVEFYGHPGEETRQLKYGILGSGNYEVVNGGIYPDVDESTAAVNSVANYVRKPGVLLAGLPKLMGSMSAADEARQAGVPPLVVGDAARLQDYMRGGSSGGASINSLSSGLFPTNHAAAYSKMTGLASPLLDVLDAAHVAGGGANAGAHAGGYFDSNLLAHLGGSGTSARTTHASRDQADLTAPTAMMDKDQDNLAGNDDDKQLLAKRKHRLNKFKQAHSNDDGDDDRENNSKRPHRVGQIRKDTMTTLESLNDSNNRIKSSDLAGPPQQGSSPGKRMNQFYSYHILPSKKVTIFSDQDLDSAPDDENQRTVYVKRELRENSGFGNRISN